MAGHYNMGFPAYPNSSSSSNTPAPSSRDRVPAPPHFYTHPSRISLLESAHGGSAGYGSYARPDSHDPDNTTPADPSRPWRGNTSALPSFSRAFHMLMTPEASDGATRGDEDGFFVPSYLQGSTYVQKLEEAHNSRIQARDASRKNPKGISPNQTGLNPRHQPLPPGSHRGMSHTVVERPPSCDTEEPLAPLPTKLNKDDLYGGLEVHSDGLTAKHLGSKSQHDRDRDHEACGIRADSFMSPECGVYYYEVHILEARRDETTIGIGFCTKPATLSRPLGWEPEAWGYHGDDGRAFTGQNIGQSYGPSYNKGDVIGCGINFRSHTAFYTKNGVKLGTAFNNISSNIKLYPAVSLKRPGEYVRVNFGQSPFVYNIIDMMKEERGVVQKQIQSTETSNLVPGMNETDLIQSLVLQFLQHDGYVEAARAFAEDMKIQKEALLLPPSAADEDINLRDDEDANNRQRIRKAILGGDIDLALKYTNKYYPTVLEGNEQMNFRLRCRKFIEMVRKAALLKSANDQKSNGLSNFTPQDMDLDMNGNGTFEADGVGKDTELLELEADMLSYGRSLQAEYASDTRKEVTKVLGEIWALLAYDNPLKQPEVNRLLDREGRVVVAEELNSAILVSLGKSSRASLEKLYAQTSVLLEDLRQDGGEGAFVSVNDIMDEVPSTTHTS